MHCVDKIRNILIILLNLNNQKLYQFLSRDIRQDVLVHFGFAQTLSKASLVSEHWFGHHSNLFNFKSFLSNVFGSYLDGDVSPPPPPLLMVYISRNLFFLLEYVIINKKKNIAKPRVKHFLYPTADTQS